MTEETYCIDCGRETAGGRRCKTCHGAWLRLQALQNTAENDRALLAMVEGEELNGSRLSKRLGISKTRAYQKIRQAREREAQRVTSV